MSVVEAASPSAARSSQLVFFLEYGTLNLNSGSMVAVYWQSRQKHSTFARPAIKRAGAERNARGTYSAAWTVSGTGTDVAGDPPETCPGKRHETSCSTCAPKGSAWINLDVLFAKAQRHSYARNPSM